jgi:hypothetical protein
LAWRHRRSGAVLDEESLHIRNVWRDRLVARNDIATVYVGSLASMAPMCAVRLILDDGSRRVLDGLAGYTGTAAVPECAEAIARWAGISRSDADANA